jgi:dethiobiotin synthetase
VVLNRQVDPRRSTPTIVVVGTGTDVGKTWVSVALLEWMKRRGVNVAARKIVQSFDPADPPERQDRALLAAATGEEALMVCHDAKSFAVAAAPPIAAKRLGLSAPTLAELLDFWPCAPDDQLLLIETAGGLRSPQASDADARDVAAWIDPDLVVLVASDELGVISQVRLCHDALGDRLFDVPIVVVLNQRNDGQDQTNVEWLRDEDGFDVVALPSELDAFGSRVVELLGLNRD